MNQKGLRKWENKDNFIYRDDIHFIIRGKFLDANEWLQEEFILIDIVRKSNSNTGKVKEELIADMQFDLEVKNIYGLDITRHTFIDYKNPDGFKYEVSKSKYNYSKFINAIGASLILNYIDVGRKLNFIVNSIYTQYKDLVDSLGFDPEDLDKESYIEFFIDEDKMNKIIYYNGETEKELSLNI